MGAATNRTCNSCILAKQVDWKPKYWFWPVTSLAYLAIPNNPNITHLFSQISNNLSKLRIKYNDIENKMYA